jgi:hypothetical protein
VILLLLAKTEVRKSGTMYNIARKAHSTLQPLTKLLNFVSQAHNSKEHVIVIFCDLRKAFDTCDHELLLKNYPKLVFVELDLVGFVII